MHDLIGANKLNLLERHVFQFDFLNDSFDKLPKPLREIINDEERRKKLVIYINPPYAEAATVRQKTGTGTNKANVARNNSVYSKYKTLMGGAVNELFAQFFIRIYNEIPSSVLAEFSTLKILQAPNFRDFRNIFRAKLGRNFLVPADTFDNVKGKFPIGFFIWHTDERKKFLDINTDVYDRHGHFMGHKGLYAPIENRLLMDWLKTKHDKKSARIAYLRMLGSDVQNNNGVFLTTTPSESDLKQRKTCDVTAANLSSITVYFSVRHCIESEWVNDRDQYQYPEASWEGDLEFQSDCLVYTLFHGQREIRQPFHDRLYQRKKSSRNRNHPRPFQPTAGSVEGERPALLLARGRRRDEGRTGTLAVLSCATRGRPQRRISRHPPAFPRTQRERKDEQWQPR